MLADLVIEPRGRRVTQLVVEPRHRHGLARLVPIALAAQAEGSGADLTLECRTSDVHRLPEVHELAYRRLSDPPVQDPDWGVGVQDVLAVPNGDFPGLGWNPGDGEPWVAVAYDRIPKGEVEIRRRSAVTSADGWPLGRLIGVVSAEDDRITHLLLRRHLLRAPHVVTLPVSAIERLDTDAISLRLTRREVDLR